MYSNRPTRSRKSRQLPLQCYETGSDANRIGAIPRWKPLHFHVVRIELKFVDYPLQSFPDNGPYLS
jgi:hypothetical protein